MSYDIVSLVPVFCQGFLKQTKFAEGGLASEESLDATRMDYSLISLHAVDRYLDAVHAGRETIEDQTYTNTVLAAGCYLGETLRRNSELGYAWVNYADFARRSADAAEIMPDGLGTAAVLMTPQGRTVMPINKIIRYIEEGPENSTFAFAERFRK